MASEPLKPVWGDSIADEDWMVYEPVLRQAEAQGIRFALGGAFALGVYTHHLRNTKDLDVYVLPSERDRMIEVVTQCGLSDYYERASYDRSWIYRSYSESRIVDIIWAMPNRRTVVDEQWLIRGPLLEIRNFAVRALPIEELFWAKIYVLQRDRCDWPDVLNLMYHSGERVDWHYLLDRMGSDFPLAAAVLTIFRWLSPDRARQLPGWLWERIGTEPSGLGGRPHLLDTRPWFGEDFQFWPG